MVEKIIIAILLIILLIWFAEMAIHSFKIKNWVDAIFDTILSFFIAFIIILALVHPLTPTSIDVYRNKTELRINGYYQDSTFIATDSIVIWKNKN